MPRTTVLFFKDASGEAPVLAWLRRLNRTDRRGCAKCGARIHRLTALGHELRRPEADSLRDGIHELRVRSGRVNYRILYFFHGRDTAVLLHAVKKEDRVDVRDMNRALRRRAAFESDPAAHTFKMERD